MLRRPIAAVVVLLLSSSPLLAQTAPGGGPPRPRCPRCRAVARRSIHLTPRGDSPAAESREVMPSSASRCSRTPGDSGTCASAQPARFWALRARGAGVSDMDRRITERGGGFAPRSMADVRAWRGAGRRPRSGRGSLCVFFAIGRLAHSPRMATVNRAGHARDSDRGHDPGPEVQCRPHASGRLTLLVPSGHSSATFATATVLQRTSGGRWGSRPTASPPSIAGSRLQENRHYLSDVVSGAAIGVVAGRTVTSNT